MSDFDLKGKRIADTYKGLLKLAVSGNGAVSSSLTQVEGGDGTNTALFVATDSVKVGGAFAVSSSVSMGGSLKVTGDVCASSYYGSGRHLTSIVATGDTSVSSLIVANTATIGGTLSVGGAVNLLSTATVSGAAGFLGTVRVSGNTSLGGTLDVAGTATFTNVDVDDINLNGKVLTITGDTDDTFKITAGTNGATTLETVDTGGASADLTLDVDGVIKLDGGNGFGSAFLYNNGTLYGSLFNSGNDFILRNKIVNGDISFQSQGGSVTALTLDMSAAGLATFNDGATFNGDVTLTGDAYNVVWDKSENSLEFADNARAKFGTGGDLEIWHDGSNSNIKSGGAGSLIIQSNFSQAGIVVVPSDKVALYYNNVLKLETTATGATVTGGIVADSATVDDINLDGKVLTITGDTGDTFKISSGTNGATTLATVDTDAASAHLTLDADGVIFLDAGDGNGILYLKNSGTTYGSIFNTGNDHNIKSEIADGDIHLRGNDGGSAITALTLDMSEAGKAIFNAGATFADDVTVEDINLSGKVLTITGDTDDTFKITTGANGYTTLATVDTAAANGHLVLDVDGQINLDAGDASGATLFKSSGTHYSTLYNSGANLYLKSEVSDGDFVFQGNDGGSTVNALILDMSDAGTATFNNDVIVNNTIKLPATTGPLIMTTADLSTIDLTLLRTGFGTDSATYGFDIKYMGSRAGNDNSYSLFMHNQAGTHVEAMTVLQNGYVGIGNTAPTSTLHVTGDATVDDINLNGKVLTITGDTDDTFKITSGADGDTTIATTDAAGANGHLRLDADGLIILDGGDTYGQTLFYNKGVAYGNVYENSNSLHIKSVISDADIHFQGNDGGSTITALTLDMSGAGWATFNTGATFGGTTYGTATVLTGAMTAASATVDDINLDGKVITITGDTGDTFTITSGANGATTLATTDAAGTEGTLKLDADGGIHLDAGSPGGPTILMASGTRYGTFVNGGNNFYLRSDISDGDLILQGYDGGSTVDALTLDMSAAGAAAFNNDVTVGDDIIMSSDQARIMLGVNNEIQITHVHNVGLTFTNFVTGTDDRPFVLQLKSEEDAIVADDVIASLEFAAGDSSGTDAATVAAGIHAIAEGEFTASANPTRLSFTTGSSESAAASATPKMTLSSAGKLGIGTTAPTELLHIASTGDATIKLEADTDNAGGEDHNPKLELVQDGGGTTASIFLDQYNILNMYNVAAGDMRFGTSNTERMRIKFDGRVGIGINDALKKLHVDGPALSTVFTLTDASTVTSDFDTGQNFTLTLAGNRTLGAPSNVDAGQVGSIFIIQDGTGSRTLAYNSIWKFAGGTAPVLSTAAGAIDRLDYIVQSGTAIQAVLTKAYA